MVRKILECPADFNYSEKGRDKTARKESWFEKHGVVEYTYTLSVVTPMFGGGTEAGEVDSITPVRGTSVRGHLRFWWRALFGGQYASAKELRDREGVIWGTTDSSSPVQIAVTMESRRADCDPSKKMSYVLFPFQENRDKKFADKGLNPFSFKLTLRYPKEFHDDVEKALRGWVLFGGLGARTRRGCGALYCKELSPRSIEELQKLSASFQAQHVETSSSSLMPARFFVGTKEEAPSKAWEKAVKVYQSFRQGENIGRNPGQNNNRPGRSRWPEPESIRRYTGRRFRDHKRLDHIPDNAFPRALFGLPIIFHFKDGGEPQDTELVPVLGRGKLNRMASPLIIKPLALAEDKAVPMLMLLQAPAPQEIGLFQGRRNCIENEDVLIEDSSLAEYRNSPMQGHTEKGNALDAFIHYAQSNTFSKEVKLS